MGQLLGVLVALGIILMAAVLLMRRRRGNRLPTEASLQPLIDEFRRSQSQLAVELLRAAAATGKPRGLRWVRCELSGEPVFAVDPRTREPVALMGATISFEAVEGGGMEDVEAVGNLRSATAVFVHRDGRWTTDGRVLFNLEPREALERFGKSLLAAN
jgi:hypothetical protein